MICPYCKSSQIHAGKRGWSMTTGIIGSSKIVVTCLDCGKESKPGQKPSQPSALNSPTAAKAVGLLIVALLTIIYIALK